LVDDYCVSLVSKLNFGWLYILCGLVLTVAAIILPAHQELQELKSKQEVIADDLEYLEYQVTIYETFLQDVVNREPDFIQRLTEMQFNRAPQGEQVVFDPSAPRTPLEWVAQRAIKSRTIQSDVQQASLLSKFTEDEGRLWVLAVGIIILFVGLTSQASPTDKTIE